MQPKKPSKKEAFSKLKKDIKKLGNKIGKLKGSQDYIKKIEDGFKSKIEVLNDFSNRLQKGSSITLWGETTTQTILGGDAIGELGKPSEIVAQEAAGRLMEEIDSQATVDVHMADILIPYVALAKGESAYLSRSVTDHLETNVWLAAEILGVEFEIDKSNDLFRISKE